MGRGTFEKVLSFEPWPYQKRVFVLSKSLNQIPGSLKDKAELIETSPKETLDYLSQKGYSTIYVDGGKVIQSFLKENLIDELIITTAPVLIGKGIPLFGPLDFDIKFKLVKTNAFSNGLVMNCYERIQRTMKNPA